MIFQKFACQAKFIQLLIYFLFFYFFIAEEDAHLGFQLLKAIVLQERIP